jgi:hypothetical protein
MRAVRSLLARRATLAVMFCLLLSAALAMLPLRVEAPP